MESGAVIQRIAERRLVHVFHADRGQRTFQRRPCETGYGGAWGKSNVNEHLNPMLFEKQQELREPTAAVAQAKDSGAR